jgi:hypothetical protein
MRFGGSLQKKAYHLVARLEERRANQLFQLLHGHTSGVLGGETSHQLLDFGFLGPEDPGWGLFFWLGFFFTPMASSARVLSTICRAYCSVICWYLW